MGSFALDVTGNSTEGLAQMVELFGHDIFRAIKGKPTMAGVRAYMRAIRDRNIVTKFAADYGVVRHPVSGEAFRPLPQAIETELGMTAYGEAVPLEKSRIWSSEIFLSHDTTVKWMIDEIVGTPLRMKATADLAFKRLGATTEIYLNAYKAAEAKGLMPWTKPYHDFVKDYWRDIPPDVVAKAINRGNKMGFNRPLVEWQRAIAKKTWLKVFTLFPRWPFQWTHALAEWLGMNTRVWKQILREGAKGEDVAGAIAKGMTGWGGIYFVGNALQGQVDYNTMEFVWPSGKRTRLSAREPIPTILTLYNIIKGDHSRAAKAWIYSSLPGAFMLESGMFGGLARYWRDTILNPQKQSWDRAERELSRFVEKSIPGQAVLKSMLKLIDPAEYEGPLRQTPIAPLVSRPRIDPTTGEQTLITESAFGTDVTRITSGAPTPGVVRDPGIVRILLDTFNQKVYKAPRDLLGKSMNALSSEERDEFLTVFGKLRQQYLKPFAEALAAQGKFRPSYFDADNVEEYENLRLKVQTLDSRALSQARKIVNAQHGVSAAPMTRQPTGRELLAPGNLGEAIEERRRPRGSRRRRRRSRRRM